MSIGRNEVAPRQPLEFFSINKKPTEKDIEQCLSRSKNRSCFAKTCCYVFAAIVCAIILLAIILIPVLWHVFNRTKSVPITTTTTTIPSFVYQQYLWPFDSTFQDLSLTFNGTSMNGAGFSSSTITGYGSSLSLSSASSQFVLLDSPFLNLSYQSWTFEMWIHPWTISSSDNSIVAQCESTTVGKCLRLVIRNGKICMDFFSDDLSGLTTLVVSKWYHVAYVYDSVSRNQSVYLDGLLDNSRTANSSYRGNNGSLMIGTSSVNGGSNMFNGLIDQLYYINRAKTTVEILDDATLTVYFSFDSGSVCDEGPLHINGTRVGSTSVVTGRVGDALQIGPSSSSHFTMSGLVLLGTSSQSYSLSIWIKPSALNGSSIIHVSAVSTGTGWCVGILGFSSLGQLIAFSWHSGAIYVVGPIPSLYIWTHVALTYSATNGLRLYINGNLWNSTVPFRYTASGVPDYLFLGSPLSGTSCGAAPVIDGQYSGSVDEFRLYSRELSAVNIFTLANP